MTLTVQQAKPRLANPFQRRFSPRTSNGKISSRRIVVWVLCCVAALILFANSQAWLQNGSNQDVATSSTDTTPSHMRRHGPLSSASSSTKNQHVPPSAASGAAVLPPLPELVMPPMDPKTHIPLDFRAMDAWAAQPLVGSFMWEQSGSPTKVRIHMPFQDLQGTYHAFGAGVDGSGTIGISGNSAKYEPRVTRHEHFASKDSVVLTRKGNKFAASGVRSNQDRIAIADYYSSADSDGTMPKDFWMGLFDGHGELGHVVAQYAILEFPQRLLRRLVMDTTTITDTTESTKQALSKLFLDINANMPNMKGAGATGISIWRRKNQLYISNVGDSMAFVVSVDPSAKHVQVIYTTKPHKPNDPVERARIEGMGGQVLEPPDPQYSWRLVIPFENEWTHEVGTIALAMSRSLGDFEGHPYGLIAEPTTDVLELSDLDPSLEYLVIAATDGLLDRISETEIARQMADSQLLTPTGKYLPLEAAERLILQASEAWAKDPFGQGYRDDISLAVHRLRI